MNVGIGFTGEHSTRSEPFGSCARHGHCQAVPVEAHREQPGLLRRWPVEGPLEADRECEGNDIALLRLYAFSGICAQLALEIHKKNFEWQGDQFLTGMANACCDSLRIVAHLGSFTSLLKGLWASVEFTMHTTAVSASMYPDAIESINL